MAVTVQATLKWKSHYFAHFQKYHLKLLNAELQKCTQIAIFK